MSSLALKDFLASLNDTELSFLFRYKYDTYMEPSQGLVKKEMVKRHLSEDTIDRLIEDTRDNPGNTHCPHCNSDKYVDDGKVRTCAICGKTTLDALVGKNRLGRIIRFLKRFSRRMDLD